MASPPDSGMIFHPFLAPNDGLIAKLTSPLIIILLIGIPFTDRSPPFSSGLPALEFLEGVAHLEFLDGVPHREPARDPDLDPARELSRDKLALKPFALVISL